MTGPKQPVRMPSTMGKRSDPAAIRQQQQKIAEDVVRREQIRARGDIVSPPLKPPVVSQPLRPVPSTVTKRVQPTSRRGIVTGFKKGSNVA